MEIILFLGLVATGLINYPFMSESIDKEVVESWNQTTLTPEVLYSVVNNKTCKKNEKSFLSCAAAVDELGRNLGIIIQPTGGYKKLWTKTASQKIKLQPWIKYKSEVDFDKILRKTFQKVSPDSHKALTGESLNAYLSIADAPHTFLEPRPKKELLPGRDSILDEDELDLELAEDEVEPLDLDLVEEEITDESIEFLLSKNTSMPSLLTLKAFNARSCQIIASKLNEAKKFKVDKLVIDLKDNPGGFIDEVACITSLFTGPKHVVTIKFLNKQLPEEIWGRRKKLFEGEITVLVNERSASASEILAGSLKYYQRATILGHTTYGKGSFQQVEKSDFDKYGLRLRKTMGLYFFPNKLTPQLTGIIPDKIPQKSFPEPHVREEEYLYPISPAIFSEASP